MLFVHPNTVRYRLRPDRDVTGYDLRRSAGGHIVRIALAVGRLAQPTARLAAPGIRDARPVPVATHSL